MKEVDTMPTPTHLLRECGACSGQVGHTARTCKHCGVTFGPGGAEKLSIGETSKRAAAQAAQVKKNRGFKRPSNRALAIGAVVLASLFLLFVLFSVSSSADQARSEAKAAVELQQTAEAKAAQLASDAEEANQAAAAAQATAQVAMDNSQMSQTEKEAAEKARLEAEVAQRQAVADAESARIDAANAAKIAQEAIDRANELAAQATATEQALVIQSENATAQAVFDATQTALVPTATAEIAQSGGQATAVPAANAFFLAVQGNGYVTPTSGTPGCFAGKLFGVNASTTKGWFLHIVFNDANGKATRFTARINGNTWRQCDIPAGPVQFTTYTAAGAKIVGGAFPGDNQGKEQLFNMYVTR